LLKHRISPTILSAEYFITYSNMRNAGLTAIEIFR